MVRSRGYSRKLERLKTTIFTTSWIIAMSTLLNDCSWPIQKPINEGYGDYVLVPAGEFQMGDNFGEGAQDEQPVHTVFLSEYHIGRYQVTNGEYKKFIDDGGYSVERYWSNGGYGGFGRYPLYWENATYRGGAIVGNDSYPVTGVTWYEASAYCSWLSEKTGNKYRLPTEAEWEKAARGTDQRRFPWGNTLDSSYANYDNHQSDPLVPVGYYDGSIRGNLQTRSNASPCGAYDMAGNVWDWCADWYDEKYYSVSPTDNPRGPQSGKIKAIRGGSWKSVPGSLRSAKRSGNDAPERRANTLGFRCVREG